jgi:hypothetical protein
MSNTDPGKRPRLWSAGTCHRFGLRRPVAAFVNHHAKRRRLRQVADDESAEAGSPTGQPGWGAFLVSALQKT